ncbi:hypothetical protein FKM82_018226 [Ascaphus truei]
MLRASDLVWLILNPETRLNVLKISKMLGREVSGFDNVKITSSAYSATLCACSPTSIPAISGHNLIWAARGSIQRATNKGDKGHPCLVPLRMLNTSEGKPWCRTLAVGPL